MSRRNNGDVRGRLTIGKKMVEEKCRLLKQRSPLSFLHRRKWRLIGNIYRSQESDPRFIETHSWRRDPEILVKIKERAREVLAEPYSKKNHDLYLMAKRWCIVPHSLKKRASKLGFTFLNLDIENDRDRDLWEMRINDYNPLDNEINLIPLLRLNDPKISMKKKIRNLKITANKLINLMNYEEYSEEAWNTIIRWFTKKRPYREFI